MAISPFDIDYKRWDSMGDPNAQANYFQGQGASQVAAPNSLAPVPQVQIDPIGGAGPAASGGLGFNMDTLKLGLGGIQTIGNLWNSYQANKLAKETFNYTKDITDQNMANSIQGYNTSLADRIRARGAFEGQSQAEQDAYIKKNSFKRQY